jgi:hypothetical protein
MSAPNRQSQAPTGNWTKATGSFRRPPIGNLLQTARIDHGPAAVLGRFLLAANEAALSRGVSLSFATFDELWRANEKNRDTWNRIPTIFDPEFCGEQLQPDRAFVILGKNADGDVVLSQACKLMDLGDRSIGDALLSQHVFFDNPDLDRLPDEKIEVTAQSAFKVKGRVSVGGAAWCRPDYRGRHLPALTSRLGRAISLAHWNVDYYVSFFVEKVALGGVAKDVGFDRGEWHMKLENARAGNAKTYFVWVDPDEIVVDLARHSAEINVGSAQVDGRVLDRGA